MPKKSYLCSSAFISGQFILFAFLTGCTSKPSPQIFLYAGEWPEDFRFLPPKRYGIAYWAATLTLDGEEFAMRPRRETLYLPLEPAALQAVVRIESRKPALTDSQRERAVAEIAKLAAVPRLSGIIVYYQASVAERDFYRALLIDLRARLPGTMSLAITAPASWCIEDPWIEDLPIGEAIPLLFLATKSHAQHDFPVSPCRHSLGLRPSPPADDPYPTRRRYFFATRPWDAAAVAALRQ